MFLNPPLDSVPNLIRPVRARVPVRAVIESDPLIRAIDHRPFFIPAGDEAIGDGHVFRRGYTPAQSCS